MSNARIVGDSIAGTVWESEVAGAVALADLALISTTKVDLRKTTVLGGIAALWGLVAVLVMGFSGI